jgi:hypothetical protein
VVELMAEKRTQRRPAAKTQRRPAATKEAATREPRAARRREARLERRDAIAQAAAERDREIHRLHAAGLSAGAIAVAVGCSKSLTFELLSAERHRRYNARRREHWHLRSVA